MCDLQKLFLKHFQYKDGFLYWKLPTVDRISVGDPVGTYIGHNGYMRVGLKGKRYYLHRVIFCMFNGYMPKIVDHINGNKIDCVISNLREANHQTNNMNRRKQTGHTSKYKGVYYNKSRNKWQAQIKFNLKCYNLGRYDNEKDAADAYNVKALELFGEFAVLNKTY